MFILMENGCTNSETNTIIVDQNAPGHAGSASAVLCNTLIADLNGSIGGANSATSTTSGKSELLIMQMH